MSDTKHYNELFRKYQKMEVDLECLNQALYDCRRTLQASQTLEVEYQEEIKALQTQNADDKEKLEKKIQQLEETNVHLKTEYDDRIDCLEKKLAAKDEETISLKEELDDIIKLTQAPNDKILEKELSNLQDTVLKLTESNIDLETLLKAGDKQIVALQEEAKQMKEELANYKEILNSKREELEETKYQMQNLKDELVCVKSELDGMKSQPLDQQSKGNSLFAEVDDRRVQLQNNMQLMKSRFLEMKQDRASLLKQIRTLRQENTTLAALGKAEIEEKQIDEEMIEDTYKCQIQALKEQVESYEREIKQLRVKAVSDPPIEGLKYLQVMIDMKNKEVDKIRKTLSERSLAFTTLTYDFIDVQRQNRKLNLENVQLNHEIEELKLTMAELETSSPKENAPTEKVIPEELKVLKSIVKNTEDVNKENEKKVQFHDDSEEPQPQTTVTTRKGCKVRYTKPTKFF